MSIMASLGLLQRLDAASSMLRTQGGARNFAEISRGQSQRIGELLQEGRFAMAEAIPWATEAEKQHLLQRLSAASVAGSRRPRARMQNFEAIASFLTEAQWTVLTSGSCDFTVKLRCLADAACALGCRHPSEGTIATMAALLLVSTEGPDKARSMPAGYLYDVFVHAKSQMKARCRGAALEDIDELSDAASFAASMVGGGAPLAAISPPAPAPAPAPAPRRNLLPLALHVAAAPEEKVAKAEEEAPGEQGEEEMGDQAEEEEEEDEEKEEPASPKLKRSVSQAAMITLRDMAQKRASGSARRGGDEAATAAGAKTAKNGAGAERTKAAGKTPKGRAEAKRLAAAGKTPSKPVGKTAAAGKKPESKPPSFSHERSRSQILFRTGLPGSGQNQTRRYTDEASEQEAIRWAKAKVQQERRRRGLA